MRRSFVFFENSSFCFWWCSKIGKKIMLLNLLVLSIAVVGLSWEVNGATKSGKNLILTTDLIREEYINQGQVRLHLRLNFANQGNSNILLYRYSSAVMESWIMKNCHTGKCVTVGNFQYNSDIYFNKTIDGLTKEDFVSLGPSKSLQIETSVDVFLLENAASFRSSEGHNYQLKILVKTLYGQRKEYNNIKKVSFNKSKLWTSDIISLPMSLEFNSMSSR